MSGQESESDTTLNEIERTDKEYVFGTWSFQSEVSPTQVIDTDGVTFTDANGNEYVDFSGQLMCSNLGHSAERVTEAVSKQINETAYVAPGFTTEARANLGKKLAEVTPGDLSKTFFSTSGTEAVEAAIKIARFYHWKAKDHLSLPFLSRSNLRVH